MRKPEASGRLVKWLIELTQFHITYLPRTAVKGQALVDFVAEFSFETKEVGKAEEKRVWALHVDGSSNVAGVGAGIVLGTPEGHLLSNAIRFKFRASNNEAEYEALLAGLRLARDLGAKHIRAFSDSKLVVGQVNKEFNTMNERMAAYLERVRGELAKFSTWEVCHVMREQNTNADALAKLTSNLESELSRTVPVALIEAPSVEKNEVNTVGHEPSWMDEIKRYLEMDALLDEKSRARRIKYNSEKFVILDGKLYKRGR